MQVNTKYDLFDYVIIRIPNIPGRIIAIKFLPTLTYSIEYWWNGELKEISLYEDEIKIKEK